MPVASEYKHSGRVGWSIIAVPLFGTLLTLVLAFLYAYAATYSPLIYLSLLFVLAYSGLTGGGIAYIGIRSKCRSSLFMSFSSFVLALLGFYMTWATFTFALLNRHGDSDVPWSGLIGLFLQPDAVWRFATAINEQGYFSISSSTPTGVFLWILWAIEALVMIVGVTLLGSSGVSRTAFCEHCEDWCEEQDPARVRMIEAEDALVARAKQGDLEALEMMAPAQEGENPHYRVDVQRCERCDRGGTYHLKEVSYTTDKDGDVSEQVTDASKWLVMSRDEWPRLNALAARTPAPVDAVPIDDVPTDSA